MSETKKPGCYRAFLLRCWEESCAVEGTTWRFSLEDTRGGKRHGFTRLEALLAALRSELCEDTEQKGEQS